MTASDAPYDHGQALEQAAQGDPALLRELASLFVEEASRLVTVLSEAVASGDWTAVGRSAHSLKGSASNFHAQETVNAAQRLEEAARAGQEGEVRAAFSALRDETRRLCQSLAGLSSLSS